MKRILTGFLFLLLVYYSSFLFISRNTLAYQLLTDSNSSYHIYQWTDSVNIISDIDFEKQGNGEIKNILKREGVVIQFIYTEMSDSIGFSLLGNTNYNYLLKTNLRRLPYVKIEEFEKIEEYAAIWEREYIWVFFRWFKIKEEMTGIS
jgi:hypothetical protein